MVLVETYKALRNAVQAFRDEPLLAIDAEGVPATIALLQVATPTHVYLLDGVKLGAGRIADALRDVLSGVDSPTKLFQDLHQDALALSNHGVDELRNVIDTQLAAEMISGEPRLGFNDVLEVFGRQPHPEKQAAKKRMKTDASMWLRRPLRPLDVKYAALDVTLLLDAMPELEARLAALDAASTEGVYGLEAAAQRPPTPAVQVVGAASEARAAFAIANHGARRIAFDAAADHRAVSAELITLRRPSDAFALSPPRKTFDYDEIIYMLPDDLRDALVATSASIGNDDGFMWTSSPIVEDVSDVVLDVGRRPQAWVGGGDRVWLNADPARLIARDELEAVLDAVCKQSSGFGSDNRAGLDGQLHRISRVRDRTDTVDTGLTIRFGRSVTGTADILADVLLGSDKSVLLLGEPGSGKTTLLRDVARMLAVDNNVAVVDTSSEIAGDGSIAHDCIGLARRFQVPSLERQAAKMIEVVQNHTPHVMVIDEIGRSQEVVAAKTTKQRGVRCVASAHGDLRKLVKNGQLNGLVGGVETVTVGDIVAAKHGGRKTLAERASAPTFDVVVMMRRGARHEVEVVRDAAVAVDAILTGEKYKFELRQRDPATGALWVRLDKA